VEEGATTHGKYLSDLSLAGNEISLTNLAVFFIEGDYGQKSVV
jgi:hypothetical protein